MGLPRLRMIFGQVMEDNTGDIVDPVWVKNHGTCFESDNETVKRIIMFPVMGIRE